MLVLVALFLLLVRSGQSVLLQSKPVESPDKYLTRNASWMTQKLDHFATQSKRSFSQRYYEFTDFFEPPTGPIFLRICGEGPCGGITNDYNAVLAKKFKAAIVSLEHRYYGMSSPFAELTTENLIYLSSKQALFDLATFRSYYQALVHQRYNTSMDNPWFVFGVSYPGALSAWFRVKFPHLVVGSIASSAVVNAIFEYTAFDEQVAESAGPACSDALRHISMLVEKGLRESPASTKALFGAEELDIDGDFLYFLADAAAIAFQYGNPDVLCSPLIEARGENEDLLAAYANYVKEYYVGSFGSSVETYNQEVLKSNISAGGPHSSDRLWWYQVCTELAYFQVAPSKNSIRPSGVNVKYHLDLCSNVFAEGTYPEVDITNMYYGGDKVAGSRVLFMNGSQDPWRHASKQTSSPGGNFVGCKLIPTFVFGHLEPSYLTRCYNCAHGVDMRGCPQIPFQIEGNTSKCENPEAANAGQALVASRIESWLQEYYADLRTRVTSKGVDVS